MTMCRITSTRRIPSTSHTHKATTRISHFHQSADPELTLLNYLDHGVCNKLSVGQFTSHRIWIRCLRILALVSNYFTTRIRLRSTCLSDSAILVMMKCFT